MEDEIDFYLDGEEELVSLDPVISFPVANQQYALPITKIKEVIKCTDITVLPQLPDHFKGLVNVRGNVYAVADLAIVFGLATDFANYKYLIILDLEGFSVALGVASVPSTIHVNLEQIQKPQHQSGEKEGLQDYLVGFLKFEEELIAFLDIDQLITSEVFSKTLT